MAATREADRKQYNSARPPGCADGGRRPENGGGDVTRCLSCPGGVSGAGAWLEQAAAPQLHLVASRPEARNGSRCVPEPCRKAVQWMSMAEKQKAAKVVDMQAVNSASLASPQVQFSLMYVMVLQRSPGIWCVACMTFKNPCS